MASSAGAAIAAAKLGGSQDGINAGGSPCARPSIGCAIIWRSSSRTKAGKLLSDPWAARDGYITVILDRSHASVERFFQQQARRRLSDAEVVQAIKLLEMQRHALLMYTSCAWFFAEISGLETVQMLAYAARAIQLAREVTGLELESGFLERLAEAPSNLPAASQRTGVTSISSSSGRWWRPCAQ